jgi:predicted aspartyl protease
MNKRNASASLIAWLALLSTFCIFADSPALASQPVKFKQLNHLVIVPVFINGTGPLDFIFDTGASLTVIDQELISQLGLTAIGAAHVNTVSGSKVMPRYRLDSLAVGTTSVENLTVTSTKMSEIHSISSRIRGILGQNFLSGVNYILNYRDRRIDFEENDGFQKRLLGNRMPVERDRRRVLVVAKHSSSAKGGARLVIDSGAANIVIFGSSRESGLDIETDAGGMINASTITGSQMLVTARMRKLQIGEEKLANLAVRIVESRAVREGRLEHGLMPASLFRAIYFNNKENFVILNPKFSE